jgi:AAA lid domain
LMLSSLNYGFDAEAEAAFTRYIAARKLQPHFANARSIRNALDRMRLRHATRLFNAGSTPTREALTTLHASDILASRVFAPTGDDDEH